MRVVIIANFPSLLDGKVSGRFVNIAQMLYERGHQVEVVVSDYDHLTKRRRVILDNKYAFGLTYLHEPGYHNNISLRRLWSHYVWGRNVGRYLKGMKEKPDVVYAAIPTYTAARYAGEYCEKVGAKFIIDVQDLWPEAFSVLVKSPIARLAFMPMEWYVNKAYSMADFIVGVSDTYRDRGMRVNGKCKKGLTVYLGNNAGVFDQARERYRVEKPDCEFWLAYIGTMGYSYDLKCAIDAVRKVNENGLAQKRVKFIAIGAGPLLGSFRQYAERAGINYDFSGALPYSEMVGKLCSCDAVINCINSGAAQSITNKVGDYALSGLPVINTQENEEYRQLIVEYHCGINCNCGDSDQVASAIESLMDNPEESSNMGKQARLLGLQRFDRRTSYLKIVDAVETLGQKTSC